MKAVHQFCFVKFHPSFVDPALNGKITKANEIIERLDREGETIATEISSIEEKLHKKRQELLCCAGNPQHMMRTIEYLQRKIEVEWPEQRSVNDINLDANLEEQAKDDINIDEKMKELSNKLNHGRRNLAEERRLLRELGELKEMQRQKEQLGHHLKTTTFERSTWNSKECIQQRIHCALKTLKDVEEQDGKLTKEHEAIKDETQKKVRPLKEKEAMINRNKARANQRILKVRMQLNKQVEEFMSCWNNDGSFRADYKRSMIASLRDRKLSCDGRRSDEKLWRKFP
ncbi:hypothetical protein Cgig2_001379 [Carnegiea gigantea]|uniref:Uncharacterized protein n=1 Tax=Carnegiea gigantea TaxID=171969 RepID=A0A9Q1KUD4_9CARY|nr:hypothetical protein Cgig2_001379 [Carnegiea gigantea]